MFTIKTDASDYTNNKLGFLIEFSTEPAQLTYPFVNAAHEIRHGHLLLSKKTAS